MAFSRKAHYAIKEVGENHVLLEDTGPWDRYMTITNAAEETVKEVSKDLNGRRLFYLDSIGDLTELKVKDGEFAGFASVSRGEFEELRKGKR